MKKIIFAVIIFLLLFESYSIFVSLDKIPPIKYMERESRTIKTEKVIADKALKWLYYDPFGKLTLESLVKRKFLSEYYGHLMDKPESVKKIKPFIKKIGLKNNFENKKYTSFNDFFTRPIPDLFSHINKDTTLIISPACGKILAFSSISEKQKFFVKGIRFSIDELIKRKLFQDAIVYIIRLTPKDYHRFYFPYDCKIVDSYPINGDLYSVSPLALLKKANVFIKNKRYVTICKNKKIGKFAIVEVGATFIGSIIQTYSSKFQKKGNEKGFFKFGGSSVVLIFPKYKIKIDDDIKKNTERGYETSIYAGERIGKLIDFK